MRASLIKEGIEIILSMHFIFFVLRIYWMAKSKKAVLSQAKRVGLFRHNVFRLCGRGPRVCLGV